MTSRKRGLTVIETLIAATVFLTAIVVLVGLFPSSARAVRQAQGHTLATHFAERELEICRAQSFDTLADRTNTYTLEVENNGATEQLTFDTEITINDVRPGLRRIVVTVNWLGTDYFNRKIEMETYAADLVP